MTFQTRVPSRFLSHIEIVHRPGERKLAETFLGLMGIDLQDAMGGRFMMAVVEPETYEPAAFFNFFGGSEVHEEQWAFERQLIAAMEGGAMGESFSAWQDRLDRDPTSGMHTGIHYTGVSAWEDTVDRFARLEEVAPELVGRAKLSCCFRPGDPGAVAPFLQAFVWTDILSAGSLAIGQRFELSAFPEGMAV